MKEMLPRSDKTAAHAGAVIVQKLAAAFCLITAKNSGPKLFPSLSPLEKMGS